MTGLAEAGSKALKVLFLAGGYGLAAQSAAQWARSLAGSRLQVEVADFDSLDLPEAPAEYPQAALVVAIHSPGERKTVLVPYCAGRIDWHLEANSEPQLQHMVARLLADLGVRTSPSTFAA